ncbi:MAG: hypothetical protein RR365_13760 [Bacteroides sp.]
MNRNGAVGERERNKVMVVLTVPCVGVFTAARRVPSVPAARVVVFAIPLRETAYCAFAEGECG